MKYFLDRANKQIYEKIISTHDKIEVLPGSCRYNFKCHMNAVHDAIENNDKKLAMCVYIDTDFEPIIHFLNYQKGKYIDNTLGHWSSTYDYFLIKHINEDDFFKINHVFVSYRNELIRSLSFFNRLTNPGIVF